MPLLSKFKSSGGSLAAVLAFARQVSQWADKKYRAPVVRAFALWGATMLVFISPQSMCSEQLLQQAWLDLQSLSADEMAGRFPGTAGHQLAEQYIVDRFAQINLQPITADFRQPFEFKTGFFSQASGVNLVSKIVGCRFPDAYVVITAHYDHLAKSGSKVFNGADDNASGVAGLLYLAARLNQSCPAFSYIFIATDAEEQGLDGAKAWLAKPLVPVAQQVLNINLDMISRGERRQRLYLAGKRSLKALTTLPDRQHNQVKLVLGHDGPQRVGAALSSGQVDWSNASDHAVFRRAGIPYMYFGVDVHPQYHTPNDDWQQIDPVFFQSALQLIYSAVLWVEQQPPAVFLQARRQG
jgi:hypothetical protein